MRFGFGFGFGVLSGAIWALRTAVNYIFRVKADAGQVVDEPATTTSFYPFNGS